MLVHFQNSARFSRGIVPLILIMVVELTASPAFAFINPQLSPSDTSIPRFWKENNETPDEAWSEMRSKVLNDQTNRVGAEFKVPPSLRRRTEFWFDIYTRYGSNEFVIHHTLYPWIVYKVVNEEQIEADGKGPQWLRRQRAEKTVTLQVRTIRAALSRLARRGNYSKLPPLEKDLFEKLREIPGPRRRVFQQAAMFVRKQLGQRDFFRNGLAISSRYLPYMEDKFKEMGLPVDLTRLPFVESSFNVKAESKVGASGIWQIMPKTGKSFMIVNSEIDERNSPIKATTAAARMLRQYQHATKSWPLTITSWNNGIGNLHVAINHARSKDLATIIARYHSGDFKFASSNFFTCFLAALHAEKYNELVFNDLEREPLQEREVIYLKKSTSVSQIEKLTGLSDLQILAYNLDLKQAVRRHNNVLPKGYALHVPKGLATASILGSHVVSKIRQTSI